MPCSSWTGRITEPFLSLGCNIVVVMAGAWRFSRAGHVEWRRIWPMFTLSVPAAWIGGRLVVPELLFVGLLATSLLAAGLLMLRRPSWSEAPPLLRGRWFEPAAGGGSSGSRRRRSTRPRN